jgi:hypothetical protein
LRSELLWRDLALTYYLISLLASRLLFYFCSTSIIWLSSNLIHFKFVFFSFYSCFIKSSIVLWLIVLRWFNSLILSYSYLIRRSFSIKIAWFTYPLCFNYYYSGWFLLTANLSDKSWELWYLWSYSYNSNTFSNKSAFFMLISLITRFNFFISCYLSLKADTNLVNYLS